jgi:hypothetical protein
MLMATVTHFHVDGQPHALNASEACNVMQFATFVLSVPLNFISIKPNKTRGSHVVPLFVLGTWQSIPICKTVAEVWRTCSDSGG